MIWFIVAIPVLVLGEFAVLWYGLFKWEQDLTQREEAIWIREQRRWKQEV